MFRNAIASKFHFSAVAGLLLFMLSAAASAAAPATDLGKSQPNAPDLSQLAPWHVYVFHRDNVEYVQINDAGNNVRAAFANANGQTLVLPMGADVERIAVQQSQATQTAGNTGNTVYRDDQLRVVTVPQKGGTTWMVMPADKSAYTAACSALTCTGVSNSM